MKNISYDNRVMVMLSGYDAENRLVETRYILCNPEYGQTVTVGASFTNASGKIATIKAFAWDGVQVFKPIAEECVFPTSR